ncbi:hypothetical protein ACFE04_029922 [Oxalis oulophora]
MPASSSSVTVISKCTIKPDPISTSPFKTLRLSVSDLPMLSCHYIQKGVLLNYPPYSFSDLVHFLKQSLSAALYHFPALAGRFNTDSEGHVHILCNDEGLDFVVATARHFNVSNTLVQPSDVPDCFKEFFAFDRVVSYSGHVRPLAAVQVTELGDAVFIGLTMNHAVTDGTSFWHFFNTFAEICKGVKKISRSPNFGRNTVFDSPAVLRFPAGGPTVTFDDNEPLRERIFHFSRESILKLKNRANNYNINNNKNNKVTLNDDSWKSVITTPLINNKKDEISSFQSLCAQLWRSVTRARKLAESKTTTFRMAVNCRHRLEPRMDPYYFGNAIQSIPTTAESGELLSHDLHWCADLLHRNVVAHDDEVVRRGVKGWENSPRLFPLGNNDGASITMGSSPRFPMYDNDFGWGRPLAVRSGKANKFDGKISAFPGREGNGSVDLEVVLAPETMTAVLTDVEIMQYVSLCMSE